MKFRPQAWRCSQGAAIRSWNLERTGSVAARFACPPAMPDMSWIFAEDTGKVNWEQTRNMRWQIIHFTHLESIACMAAFCAASQIFVFHL